MSDEPQTADGSRNVDAEIVASRKGVPIEVAEKAVETTGGGGNDADREADATKSQPSDNGRR